MLIRKGRKDKGLLFVSRMNQSLCVVKK